MNASILSIAIIMFINIAIISNVFSFTFRRLDGVIEV